MNNLPGDDKLLSFSGPGIIKEKEIGQVKIPEKVSIVEVGRVPKTPGEEEGYIERVEKEVELQRPVIDDSGQVLVTSPSAQTPRIILPLSEKSYLNPKNWHRPVTEALRWLLEWTKRIIKMKPREAVFRESMGE